MLATLATRLAEDLHSYIDQRIQEIIKLAEQQDRLIADLARKTRQEKMESAQKTLPVMESSRSHQAATDVRLPSYKEFLAMTGSPIGGGSPTCGVELTPLRPYAKRCRDSVGQGAVDEKSAEHKESHASTLSPHTPTRPLIFDVDAEVVEVDSSPRDSDIQRPPKRPKIPIERRGTPTRDPLKPIDEPNVPPPESVVNTHRATVPDLTRPEERPNERAVVRGREARQQLDGFACPQCTAFYSAAGFDPKGNRCTHGSSEVVNAASRHRYYKPPTNTPSGFWDIWSFPPSPEGRQSSIGNTPGS